MTATDPGAGELAACQTLFRTGRYAEAEAAAQRLLADPARPLADRVELLRLSALALAEIGEHRRAAAG